MLAVHSNAYACLRRSTSHYYYMAKSAAWQGESRNSAMDLCGDGSREMAIHAGSAIRPRQGL